MTDFEEKPAPRPGASDRDARDESGQGLAEYALILAFVFAAAIFALGSLGTAIADSQGFKLFDMIP
jgi:Flp pilus assembly pilin Flp